ncbi:hypothetical protein [Roseibium album]|uniref:hypothetical protein n=1 Tax=Roseibium album TaxID=311410 RepID=UPI0024918B8E|nr:hypothetical protein [Roseibium album]
MLGLFVGFVGGTIHTENGIDWKEWIGATSGWAAAAAAIATIYFIRKTLTEAQSANAVARHANSMLEDQTKAVTGELKPVFNHGGYVMQLHQMNYRATEKFRFWNYNRRTITFVGLRLAKETKHLFLEDVRFRNVAKDPDSTLEPFGIKGLTFGQSGWRARQETEVLGTPVGAHCRPVEFEITFCTEGNLPLPEDLGVTVEVIWRFRDAQRTEQVITSCPAIINSKGRLDI